MALIKVWILTSYCSTLFAAGFQHSHLVEMFGYWHNSFENAMLHTAALNVMPKDAPDYDIAEVYIFTILDKDNHITAEAIAVSFKQDGERVILNYRDRLFTVLSANSYEISFTDGFAGYSFKRPPNHVLNKDI